MGIRPSFPIKEDPIYYEPREAYNCIGEKRDSDFFTQETSLFHKIQDEFWKELAEDRKRDTEARQKFTGLDEETINNLLQRFPKFDLEEIDDLRLQFQCFDLNGDGLIDHPELMQVLDDIGDTSDKEKREAYFKEIDEDGSGAIDFEEFMGLVYRLRTQETDDRVGINLNKIAMLTKRGSENVKALRNFSLSDQILNGLF